VKHKSVYAKVGFDLPVRMYFVMLGMECTTVLTHVMERFWCCGRKRSMGM